MRFCFITYWLKICSLSVKFFHVSTMKNLNFNYKSTSPVFINLIFIIDLNRSRKKRKVGTLMRKF